MIKFITPNQKEFLQFVVSSDALVPRFKPLLEEVIEMGCYNDTQTARGFEEVFPVITEAEILNRVRNNWLVDYERYLHTLKGND